MTEDRPATRFDEADFLGDPPMCLTKFRDDPTNRWPYLCTLDVGHDGAHDWPGLYSEPEAHRSGAVFLYLAVALAIAAGAAIAVLWWTFRGGA